MNNNNNIKNGKNKRKKNKNERDDQIKDDMVINYQKKYIKRQNYDASGNNNVDGRSDRA